MSTEQEALEILRRIEAHLAKGLEAQNEHLALAKEEYLKAQARVEQSLKFQEISVQRQKRIQTVTIPLILVLSCIVIYIGFKWHVF